MGWLKPLPGESLESYAARYIPQITSEKPVLVGYSFGGMIALELLKVLPESKIILISSVKTRKEIPFYIRLAGMLRLYKFITLSRVLKIRGLVPFFFEAKREEKDLVVDMLKKTDPVVFKWAMEKLCTWKNRKVPAEIVHVHGTRDKILPYRCVKCNYPVQGGGHLMILNRAGELSELLKRVI